MPIRPLSDKILVRPDPAESRTEGGLYIPDQAQEKAMIGTVIATGPGRWEDGGFKEPQVKTGDKVVYGKYGGTEVNVDGEELLIMPESDILGIRRSKT